jgi:hypothetical protein
MSIVRSTVWSVVAIAAMMAASHAAPRITDTGAMPARSDAGLQAIAAAHTVKQQCINGCRARYRDCRRLNQVPSFECRGIYQDCIRYSCTGLGPG